MSIAKFLNSARIKSKLDAVIDNTSAFLVDPNKERFLKEAGVEPDKELLDQYGIMDEYAPMEVSDDFRVLEYLVERNMAIASIIANGQEIPQTSAGRLIEVNGKFGKIAISIIFNEDQEIRFMELSKMPGMPNGFMNMLVKDVDSLQSRVVKTANVLTWQCFTQGFVDFTDPRSNTVLRLRYQTYPELFPVPLTGNAPGSAVWNDPVNANGILNLQEHSNAFYNLNGFYPTETAMTKQLYQSLIRQQSTRDQALSLGLITNVPGNTVQAVMSKKILDEICKELDIPPIRIYDAQYEIEVAPGQTIRGRYLPSDTYVFLTKGMAKRLFGPTIEAKGKPGIFVMNEETLKTSPPESRSYAVGRMIPFVAQPKKLAARKVL